MKRMGHCVIQVVGTEHACDCPKGHGCHSEGSQTCTHMPCDSTSHVCTQPALSRREIEAQEGQATSCMNLLAPADATVEVEEVEDEASSEESTSEK